MYRQTQSLIFHRHASDTRQHASPLLGALLVAALLARLFVRGVPAPFPKVLGEGQLGRLAVKANQALIALSPSLFSYQIYIEAKTTPNVDFILGNTKQMSENRGRRVGSSF